VYVQEIIHLQPPGGTVFSERLANEPEQITRCNLGLLVDSLDEKERIALETMIQAWSAEKLSVAIREEGSVIGPKLISKHKNKKCICEDK
jgi:hypothetical protein